MDLITNFGKEVAKIAIGFIFFFLFLFLFPGVFLSIQPNYKKLFYNSIMVACFMLFLFLGLVLSENLRFLKANRLNAGLILFISYVLALKKSKELLPETDLKLRELVLKLISCLEIEVPISVIIIIGLFNYSFANHSFACFVAVIIIIILNLLRKRNVENITRIIRRALAEMPVPVIYFFVHLFYFVRLLIIYQIFLSVFIKSNVYGFIKSISCIKSIIIIKPDLKFYIMGIFIILFDLIVNYFIEDKLNKLFKK
jgi:hypothetical protein